MARTPLRHHGLLLLPGLAAVAALAFPRAALAETFHVGPAREHQTLDDVAGLIGPGDVVEVDGDAVYPGDVALDASGTAQEKIRIRGVPVDGKRPVLSGGTNTVVFNGNHYVFEGFEVTGGASRCVFHHAHDITLRDVVVHDCPGHGVLGADEGSGSLTMEYVEVYACGAGDTKHPVYIATDESAYPGSVFRMQHCFVHDGNGGNNVKSRAERNEIFYNWIEGATYHEIELIGPDGQDEDIAREDSDVVGNVFVKTGDWYVARVGGDGTGQTHGRYRFVGNTFLLAPESNAAFRMFDGIESIEMHDNVFHRAGGGAVEVYVDGSATWATGEPVIAGSRNWVPDGTEAPAGWTGTLAGAEPGFVDVAAFDLRPAKGSPLIDAGAAETASPPGFPFPSPLAAPAFLPPPRALEAPDTATPRPIGGAMDIGAYELEGPPPVEQGGGDTEGPGGEDGTPGPWDEGPADVEGGAMDDKEGAAAGTSCSVALPRGGGRGGAPAAIGAVGLFAAAAALRRRRARRQ